MSETDVKRAILEAAAYEPGLMLERLQAGTARGGRMHLARKGAADLVGTLQDFRADYSVRHGIPIAIETKKPDAKAKKQHDAEQELWAKKWRACGGFYARVQSVDEFRAAIARARIGESR